MALSLSQFLALFGWFLLAVLLAFLLLIARFYERFSGKRMYFRAYLIPLVCFAAAAVRYASIGQITGDPLGALALSIGGLVLLSLSALLAWSMLFSGPGPTEQIDNELR